MNRARRNVCEEFEDDLVFARVALELHGSILARLRLVDDFVVSLVGLLLIHFAGLVVLVRKRVQSILHESVSIAHVLRIVEEDQRARRVLVEDALQPVRRLLQILFPLSLKESETFASN